jgi:hypothetical protein
MLGSSSTFRRPLLFAALASAAAVTACSGGGSSSTAPPPGPPLGGIGPSVALTERVNFTVVVPPAATANAVAAARRKRFRRLATITNPYVSPKTGSVSLQIATVDGANPRTLPAPVTVSIACPDTTGCSVPIQNVPAAKGVDRFTVETFTGPGGTGNIISSGFVDVTVPSAQAVSFGGTALSIGGFVQSISLALNIPGGAFTWKTPANGTIDVNAIDPAGAIIIGNDQLANPIQVSLPDTNGGAFAMNGSAQVALQQPAQTIALAYNGAVLFGGSVTASTTDENTQAVATSIPIPLRAPPTPTPTAVPSSKPPLSLYVYDAAADRILEFAGINGVEGGQPLGTTPRRIFDVAPPPALVPSLNSNCNPTGGPIPILTDMAIRSDGTIYAQTTCADAATNSHQYVFTYAASTQETVPAQGTPIPPIPTSTFTVSTAPGGTAFTQGIALDEAHGTVLLAYSPAVGNVFTGDNVIGVPLNNPTNPTTNFGANCLQQFGTGTTCTSEATSAYGGAPNNLAVDANGNIYVPTAYSGIDSNFNPVAPPGPASEAVPGEPAILMFPPRLLDQAPTPKSALGGFHDELGTALQAPTTVAIEGSTLYVLANPGTIANPSTAILDNAGLSGCPPPSATAAADTDSATSSCEATGSGLSEYIVGFPNAIAALTAAGNAGTNVVASPGFMLGGDVVGGFGGPFNTANLGGKQFTVRDGFAYVLNVLPPPYSGQPPEIDVYNVTNVTGFHTDIAPVSRLVLDAPISPTTIAIGATGTGIGGQALLRRPARVHHDVKAWLRSLQLRRRLPRGMPR